MSNQKERPFPPLMMKKVSERSLSKAKQWTDQVSFCSFLKGGASKDFRPAQGLEKVNSSWVRMHKFFGYSQTLRFPFPSSARWRGSMLCPWGLPSSSNKMMHTRGFCEWPGATATLWNSYWYRDLHYDPGLRETEASITAWEQLTKFFQTFASCLKCMKQSKYSIPP